MGLRTHFVEKSRRVRTVGSAAISCDSPSLTLRVRTAASILTRSVSEGGTTFFTVYWLATGLECDFFKGLHDHESLTIEFHLE